MPVFLKSLLRSIVAFRFCQSALSQATHRVTLGVSGSIPDPPTTAAQLNDIVTFIFGNGIHGVTQSTFDNPCVPLPGGFNSGLVSALNTSEPIKTWDLRITNASQPIWFYCQYTRPQPHCANGMVGSINAPADMYVSFQAAAKLYTGTQDPSPSVVLSGQGAFATNLPSAPPGSVAPSSITPSPTSSVVVTTAFITPSPVIRSTSNAGAIAGGVVGGLAVLGIIITVAILLFRADRRKDEAYYRERFSNIPHDYDPQSPRSPPLMQQYTGSGQASANARVNTVNPNDFSRQAPSSPTVTDDRRLTLLPGSDGGSTAAHGVYMDVRELAKEIAQLVNPSGGSGPSHVPSEGGPVVGSGSAASNVSSSAIDGPPTYRGH